MSVSSIALVVLYFGELPNYFPITLATIARNPTIDWLLVRESDVAIPLPPNLKILRMPLSELTDQFCTHVGSFVKIPSPHALCSLRPALGLVLADQLKGYDYWGHTDLDLLYGNLRHYLPEVILGSHDRIYCRGHLSLYRNETKVNHAFMLPTPGTQGYEDVFRDPAGKQFDEWQGIHRIMRYHGFNQYHREVIADIKPPSRLRITRFETECPPNHPCQIFYWHQGRTYRAYLHPEGGIMDEEVAYIHFQKRVFPAPDPELHQADGFGVGPQGFFRYDREPLTPAEFRQLNSASFKPVRTILGEIINHKF